MAVRYVMNTCQIYFNYFIQEFANNMQPSYVNDIIFTFLAS